MGRRRVLAWWEYEHAGYRGWPKRVVYILKRNGIHDPAELSNFDDAALLKLRLLGPKSLHEIRLRQAERDRVANRLIDLG